MYTVRDIYDASHSLRETFENGSLSVDEIASAYGGPQAYRAALQIREAVLTFPVDNCAIATTLLRHKLGRGDRVYGAYDTKEHTFLQIDTADAGRVVADITADQFGGPAIYVGKLVLPWTAEFIAQPDAYTATSAVA